MKQVIIPALGVAMTEALLLQWLVEPDEEVVEGQPLAEIETDKATMEIESPAQGRLGQRLFEAGSYVPIGAEISRIIEPEDRLDEALGDTAALPSSAATQGYDRVPVVHPPEPAPGTSPRAPHALSPRQRRLAAQNARASSQGDARAQASPIADATVAAPPRATVPSGRYRNLIAAKVTEAWRTIPHFAVTREVDARALLSAREAVRESLPNLTLTDLLLRALALALAQTGSPAPVDIGLVVATDQGVSIPVMGDVLGHTLPELSQLRRAAVERARLGRLRQEDFAGSPTCSLSNLGPLGIDQFTGVVALGQESLLTVGRVMDRPSVMEGQVHVRPSFFATLNVDHRVFDGDGAARLLLAFIAAAESDKQLVAERA